MTAICDIATRVERRSTFSSARYRIEEIQGSYDPPVARWHRRSVSRRQVALVTGRMAHVETAAKRRRGRGFESPSLLAFARTRRGCARSRHERCTSPACAHLGVPSGSASPITKCGACRARHLSAWLFFLGERSKMTTTPVGFRDQHDGAPPHALVGLRSVWLP